MVTWGDEISGGYCSNVKAALRGVHKVYPTRKAFAPILKDGRYCCDLGNQNYGGDGSIVKATLRGVNQIYSSCICRSFEGSDCGYLGWQIRPWRLK